MQQTSKSGNFITQQCRNHSVRLKFQASFFARAIAFIGIIFFTLLPGKIFSQAGADATANPSLLSDAEIRKILIDRIDVMRKGVGMVVGITSPEGRRVISYGQLNQGDSRPLNGETVFEIGSITKIFTALLLADMVQKKEMSLSDPVQMYLPKGSKIPGRNDHIITLADLATHTSALPFIPTNMGIDLNKADTYSKEDLHKLSCQYTDDKFYQFLSTYQLPRDIGTEWQYSNVDYALLGKALSKRGGQNYESLIRKRITVPLKMESTALNITADMKKRLGSGHDSKLQPTPEICMSAMESAGSLQSTVNDLLNFLDVFTGYKKSNLSATANSMLDTHRQGPGFDQALGWWIISFGKEDDKVVFFGGETLGYTSTIAFDPKTKTGVVVFINSDQTDGGLGLHLLRPASPLETSESIKKLEEKKEIKLDAKILNGYTGMYQSDPPSGIITIEAHADSLILKSSTTPPDGVLLYPERINKFFIKGIDLQVTFQTNDQGKATGLVIHFAGKDYFSKRIDKDDKN